MNLDVLWGFLVGVAAIWIFCYFYPKDKDN